MLFHYISASDVQPGDHLYRWRNFKLLQGIAVQRNDDRSQIYVVRLTDLNGFRLVTLQEFQGRGTLRRALYDQGNSYLHPIKLAGTSFIERKRPVDEVIQNALLLLNMQNFNSEHIKQLFGYNGHDFARLCCTMNDEQWRNHLQTNGKRNEVI